VEDYERLVSELTDQFRLYSIDLIREFLGKEPKRFEINTEKMKLVVSIHPVSFSVYVGSVDYPNCRIGCVSGVVITSNKLSLEFLECAVHAIKIVLLREILR